VKINGLFFALRAVRCDREKEGMKRDENVLLLQRLIDKRAVAARCARDAGKLGPHTPRKVQLSEKTP
jgi:hypothetical protein